ncbi:MAG: hypothetical protein M5U28_43930 [Sandaracinaceae bacterium]|nr:hypothetical protein [Sandaracinaceae bacterium]
MSPAPVLDATRLPRHGPRGRSPVYWGGGLARPHRGHRLPLDDHELLLPRGRPRGSVPAPERRSPDVVLSALALGSSALALVPVHFAERAARLGHTWRMRAALATTALLGGGYVALSAIDLGGRDYLWSSHAYGSIVWTLSGYQLLHVVLALLAAAAMCGFSFPHRVEGERRAPVQALATYWDFVVAAGALSFFTLYISPRLA